MSLTFVSNKIIEIKGGPNTKSKSSGISMTYTIGPFHFSTMNGPTLQTCSFLTVLEGNHLGLIRTMT